MGRNLNDWLNIKKIADSSAKQGGARQAGYNFVESHGQAPSFWSSLNFGYIRQKYGESFAAGMTEAIQRQWAKAGYSDFFDPNATNPYAGDYAGVTPYKPPEPKTDPPPAPPAGGSGSGGAGASGGGGADNPKSDPDPKPTGPNPFAGLFGDSDDGDKGGGSDNTMLYILAAGAVVAVVMMSK